MSKILVMPSSVEMIETLPCDGFIIGIEGLSVNMPHYFTLEDLKRIPLGKVILVALNKNFHNGDLDLLKKTLKDLLSYPIEGVIFYDIAVPQLKKKHDFPFELVWSQEHLTTNATTANFWYREGAHYTWISNELTLREVKEMTSEYQGKTLLTVFGHLPMFVSKRHLVRNYLSTFSLDAKGERYTIAKEGFQYPILDRESGTEVYSEYILNGLEEYLELADTLTYAVINSFLLPEEMVFKVVAMFQTVNRDNIAAYQDQISEMKETKHGFFHRETVYKVKKNG